METMFSLSRPRYHNWDDKELQNESNLMNLIVHIAEKLRRRWNINAEKVEEAVNHISMQQRIGWEEGNYIDIDYDDMSMCIGHLHRYSGCHCALVLHETRQLHCVIEDLIKYWCKDNCFRIVSLGGGPGTDILAFCKGSIDVLQKHKQLQLHLTVLDLKSGWKTVFDEIMLEAKGKEEASNNLTPLFGLNSTWDFVQADMRTEKMDQLGSADVILMVKALSNISEHERPRILQNVFASMKMGALFLFIDTFLDDVVPEINRHMAELLRKSGIFVVIPIPTQYAAISECTYDVCAIRKIA